MKKKELENEKKLIELFNLPVGIFDILHEEEKKKKKESVKNVISFFTNFLPRWLLFILIFVLLIYLGEITGCNKALDKMEDNNYTAYQK